MLTEVERVVLELESRRAELATVVAAAATTAAIRKKAQMRE